MLKSLQEVTTGIEKDMYKGHSESEEKFIQYKDLQIVYISFDQIQVVVTKDIGQITPVETIGEKNQLKTLHNQVMSDYDVMQELYQDLSNLTRVTLGVDVMTLKTPKLKKKYKDILIKEGKKNLIKEIFTPVQMLLKRMRTNRRSRDESQKVVRQAYFQSYNTRI